MTPLALVTTDTTRTSFRVARPYCHVFGWTFGPVVDYAPLMIGRGGQLSMTQHFHVHGGRRHGRRTWVYCELAPFFLNFKFKKEACKGGVSKEECSGRSER